VVANLGDVDDPEIDLRFGRPRVGRSKGDIFHKNR